MFTGCTAERRVVRTSGWASLPKSLFADEASYEAAQGQYANAQAGHPLGFLMSGSNPTDTDRDTDPTANAKAQWTIALRTFTGPQRQAQADRLLRAIGPRLAGKSLWVHNTDGRAVVYFGRFDDPNSRRAQAALRSIRAFERQGETPFADAELRPWDRRTQRPSDPLNARRYLGYYTLRVAFFEDVSGQDRHAAAEAMARQLRADGVEAYYYHGEKHSLVTIGLFTHEQAFTPIPHPLSPNASIDAYSAEVQALQKRFPTFLKNGKAPAVHEGKTVESAVAQIF